MHAGRLYDPYEGISQVVGMRKQTFKLPEQPEFLFEEEASVRRRGWGENLQFYTGLGYLTGAGELVRRTQEEEEEVVASGAHTPRG
jgi:hypothetical protein